MRDEDIVRIGRKLNNRDYLLLKYLYYYRCLSVRQCWDLCYRDVGVDEHTFIKKRIKPFLTYNLISLKKTAKAYVLSITDIGIEILSNRISLNNDFFDPKTKTVRTGVLKESKIQISPRLMDHQIFLNQFVVDFSRRFKREEISKNSGYRYFDEKFMSKYPFIRPDGMISLPNKLDLFLEMDMGTESKKQLIDKWVKYRLTLEALEAKGNDNKIVVLFILGNLPPDKIETRKQIVRYTIDQTLSHDFIDKFDIYIGTESELIAAVFEKIIPTHYRQYSFDKKIVDGVFKRKFKYQATPGSELKNCFYNASYAYYIRKVGPDKLIEVKNNKVQEFLYDDYIYQPLSVLNKIQFHKKHSSLFNAKHKREIDYIVLVQDLSIIKNDLEIINLLEAEGVYYTTPQRLVQLPFARAIVQFDNEGNVYHFKDSSLREKVLEN